MINSKNTFKKSIRKIKLDEESQGKEELSEKKKKKLVEQTKMYIFMQDVLGKVKDYFEEGEEIVDYFPFTNEENSAIGTAGPMAMTYVTTDEAKAYRDTFHDLRGNRLLIMTNKKMFFFVIIEFLEERLFYTYPYETLKAIRLERHKVGFFEWESALHIKRNHTYWYTLDFQSTKHVFTEMLTVSEADRFMESVEKIPALQRIPIDGQMHRDNKFDFVFSNVKMAIFIVTAFFVIIAGLFLFELIRGFFFGGGIYQDMYLFSQQLNESVRTLLYT